MNVIHRTTCRACGGRLITLFSLGEQLVINFGDKEQVKAPLELTKCKSCHLVQLRHTLDREKLFRHYYYKSGTNATMREHLRGIVEEVQKRVKLERGDNVVDIGANDGTLLSFYGEQLSLIGFEPSRKEPDNPNIWQWKNDFFSAVNYEPIAHKAKVITAIAMFYDLDDPNTFLQDIKKVLASDGLFVIEMNYLPAMLKNLAVDNICHEHLCYYSLHTLDKLLIKHGLQIMDYSLSNINGGSFRTYIKHADNPQLADFPEEGQQMLHTLTPYKTFRDGIAETAYKLKAHIVREKLKGRETYIYGASTRGATLLQLAGLDDKRLIPFAVERNPDKVGRMYLNKIPVISEEQARQSPPYYYLALPWAFRGEFIDREWTHITNSGAMIFPLPQFRIVRGSEV